MSADEVGFTCRQCGDDIQSATADRRGWCEACRHKVVRRAGALAMMPALLIAIGYFYLIDYFDLFNSNFLIIWIALGVALAYVTFKIARRVFFDVVRARTARRAAR